MQINIQVLTFSLANGLRKHVEQRLSTASSPKEKPVRRQLVQQSDLNNTGKRGAKRCRTLVLLPGLPGVMVEETETDILTAIDRAVDRAVDRTGRPLLQQAEKVHE